ncbi:hypothetical protein CRYUN_Cryun19dG0132700 [Craigia yunnanensis]
MSGTSMSCPHLSDIQPDDYIPYLCGLGYKEEEVGILAHRSVKCSEKSTIPEAPKGVDVIVKPSTLDFLELNQKATYSITFTQVESAYKIGEFTQGYIKWVSAKYFVRSPTAVRSPILTGEVKKKK